MSESLSSTIDDLLSQMTLEEKVSLCHAAGKFQNHGVDRLGIPPLVMSDGPHGVRQELNMHSWDPLICDTDHTTYLPVGTVTASTWNPALARAFGEVLGSESRARSKDVILGPGINVIRDPLCGRNFEYLSEDPALIVALAPEIIRGIQSSDTAACVKHFALNNQELNRNGYSAEPDERTLREIYLPGFAAAVRAGCLTLMGAYNLFRGQHCCHNRTLLVDILKGEWGFPGLVVSDWNGCHDAGEAALNGLDIEMGTEAESYDEYYLARPFLDGLRSGRYPIEVLDDKVRRILHVIQAIKIGQPERKSGRQHPPEHLAIGRRIAEEGFVLLKNDGILPLQPGAFRKVAVLGDNATRLHALGGGSSGVKALYEVTPLEALRQLWGDEVEILHAKAYPEDAFELPQIPDHCLATVDAGSGVKGWKVEWNNFHQFEGPTLAVEYREKVHLQLAADATVAPGQRRNWWAVRWTARLTPPVTGVYHFALNADAAALLRVNGETLIQFTQNKELFLYSASVALEAGHAVDLEIEYRHMEGETWLDFGWYLPGEEIPGVGRVQEEAVQAAAAADLVLFFGGLNHFHDNEGADRQSYALPGGQDAVLDAILAVNPNVVIILVSGSAHAMPWADRVRAIGLGGYAGMDCGNVFADILMGKVNPSGKLPYTIAHRLEDYPARALDDVHADVVRYREGVLVGYRWFDEKGIEPLFPFGHGLSYTTFELSSLRVQRHEGSLLVEVDIANTGKRSGSEVIQIYVSRPESSVFHAPRELKAFAKATLAPGERRTLSLSIEEDALAYWDTVSSSWTNHTGPLVIHAGTSSRHLPLQQTLV